MQLRSFSSYKTIVPRQPDAARLAEDRVQCGSADVQSPQHIVVPPSHNPRRQHSYNLRSATTTLCQPSTAMTFAKRAHRCSALAVSNSLPKTVVNCDSTTVFKSRLKTFLFSRAFSLPFSH